MNAEKMCTPIFIVWVCETLMFCYEIASETKVSHANQVIFFCNQDVCAHMMGCKASLTSHRMCMYVLVTGKNGSFARDT